MALDAAGAERQIKQMISFIIQEAKEKAEEIMVKTEAECNSKKLDREAHARLEITEEFEKKKKEAAAAKRITRSRLINDARFSQMSQRDLILKDLQKSVRKELAKVCKNPKYPQLVQGLITEGLMTIMEKNVEVQCRKEDLSIVQKVLPAAHKAYEATMKAECGVVPKITVKVNTEKFLAPGPSDNSKGVTCTGGVILSARRGKILCRNTLDARFEKAFSDLLPLIRSMVFGEREAPVTKAPKEPPAHH